MKVRLHNGRRCYDKYAPKIKFGLVTEWASVGMEDWEVLSWQTIPQEARARVYRRLAEVPAGSVITSVIGGVEYRFRAVPDEPLIAAMIVEKEMDK